MATVTCKTLTDTDSLIDEATLSEFRAALRGQLLTAVDPGYDECRQIHNGMHDKRPGLIARCTGVADVIAAVNFARSRELLVAVRGGGHNVAGNASCDGGIMIDLSLMRAVHVNAKARTARVQAGATLGDMDRETQVFGLAAPGGNVSTTGVAGLTLGGGLNHLRRQYGLALDNLLSADVVTANGDFLTASETENADLFWGLRGGGGNFGVVTSFEFRLHPVGPMVALCAVWYPVEGAAAMLAKWRDFVEAAPEQFASLALFWTVPAAPGIPEQFHNKRSFLVAGVHTGALEDGLKFIQPLRELGTPMIDQSGPAPWTAVQSAFDPFFPKGVRQYHFKSRYLKSMDDATIAALLPRAINPPALPILIAIWQLGGALARVEPGATAYVGREWPYLFSVDCVWDDPAQTPAVLAYSRDYLKEMDLYLAKGLYVNFAGLGEEGEKLVKDAYGDNYKRLVALKTKYDPGNLFRLNQNIRPAA